MAPAFLKMDLLKTLDISMLPVIFVFLFMGVFDTVGTLAGVSELGGFMKDGKLPRAGKALFTDAVGTCIGAACGTPTVTCYVESAAGITSGGRSGLASVVTGLLFLGAVFFSPLVKMIGGGYLTPKGLLIYPITAPALIIVGCMIMATIVKIKWDDFSESIPAFLTILIMPLTFSIANGIAIGFTSYSLIKLFSGRGKEVSWLVYILSGLFILRFIFIK
jgi:AGZA family xanthine/uracil permease-like MFS transporter